MFCLESTTGHLFEARLNNCSHQIERREDRAREIYLFCIILRTWFVHSTRYWPLVHKQLCLHKPTY